MKTTYTSPIPLVLDTSEIEAQNFDFLNPRFKRLEELCSYGVVEYLMTLPTESETLTHIREKCDQAIGAYRRTRRKEGKILHATKTFKILINNEYLNPNIAHEEILSAYNQFKTNCLARFISPELFSLSNLWFDFDKLNPPFTNRRDYKGLNDAIALEQIRSWHAVTGKSIHAVSRDINWIDYASNNRFIQIHESIDAFIDHATKIQPLKSFGGNIDRLLEYVRTLDSDNKIIDSTEFVITNSDVYPASTIKLESSDESFENLIDYVKHHSTGLLASNKRIIIRTISNPPIYILKASVKYPSRLYYYIELARSFDASNFDVLKTAELYWPPIASFYLRWLLSERSHLQSISPLSLPNGARIVDLDYFINALLNNIIENPPYSLVRSSLQNMHDLYNEYGRDGMKAGGLRIAPEVRFTQRASGS
ncbi:MAG TPA: PIN domain-containing protein [Rubricoccaceae bacterium]